MFLKSHPGGYEKKLTNRTNKTRMMQARKARRNLVEKTTAITLSLTNSLFIALIRFYLSKVRLLFLILDCWLIKIQT